MKLARELGRRDTGRTLYILDEPTTGLHFDDVRKLLHVPGPAGGRRQHRGGVEHNLDVIKTADHVIDLGPEAGAGGGRVVAAGTPEEVARSRREPHRRATCGRCSARRSRAARHDAPLAAATTAPAGWRRRVPHPRAHAPTWSATRWGPCRAAAAASSRSTPHWADARRAGLGRGLVGHAGRRWATRSGRIIGAAAGLAW